jgi:hypothetical protein
MPTHVFNFHFELLLRPLGRSLEGHVLQKVGRSIVGRRFIPRTGIDPDADRRRFAPGDSFAAHPQSIVERGHIGRGSPQDVIGKARKAACDNSTAAGGRQCLREELN